MPSVYTIEGAGRRKRKKRRGTKTAQQRKMAAAAKKCKGQAIAAFRRCVKRELKS